VITGEGGGGTQNTTSASKTAEVKGLTALSLGLILVGTANDEVALELFTYLMEASTTGTTGTGTGTPAQQQKATADFFADPNTRFIALGIALIYLGMVGTGVRGQRVLSQCAL